MGGCSSSPQQVAFKKGTRDKQMLKLVVHRMFTRARRTDVNMMVDTTMVDEEIGISLLCEDQAEDFSVVKLDAEFRKGGSCGLVFGTIWEVVVGSKVVITSPLHVQDRIIRSNKHKLVSVVQSIRNTNQEILLCDESFSWVNLGVGGGGCGANKLRAQQLYSRTHPPPPVPPSGGC